MMERAFALIAAALVMLGAALPARSETACSFSGPTPGFDAVLLDLPQGSTFLTLDISGVREQRPLSSNDDWHLAQGIFVIEKETRALVAWRISSHGMAPRRAVAEAGGSRVTQDAPGPEVPFNHGVSGVPATLASGKYYVIAFGTQGGSPPPFEQWTAAVHVSGAHACTGVGSGGATFDYDHTDFGGGSQIYLPGAGMADGARLSLDLAGSIVVGMMDAQSQLTVSDVKLDYTTPTAWGTVTETLAPFLSTAGAYSFSARYAGGYPLVAIAGVAMTV